MRRVEYLASNGRTYEKGSILDDLAFPD